MKNTSDVPLTGLSDEALDPAPTQQAFASNYHAPGCLCGNISDEDLDAPEQQALSNACNISDEPLDPPEQQALSCQCVCGVCYCRYCNRISDEALDTPEQPALACVMPCGGLCGISDEELDVPHARALTCTIGLGVCIGNCARPLG